jgi:glutamate racemase
LKNRAIGVFDSGFGGLTVVSQIFKNLPQEEIIYFGDTAHLPYGTKSKDTVTGFSLKIVDFLEKQGVKLIVVGCNTASSYAIEALKEATDIPIVDVISPGAKAVMGLTKNNKIGIIGTTATIRSKSYEKAISELNTNISISVQACPLFVPLVEEGWIDEQVTLLIAKEYLGPLKNEKVDTLVLGCTHYPLLKKMITRVMGVNVNLVDSAEETAREVKRVLGEKSMLREAEDGAVKHRYYVSDDPEKFVSLGRRFLEKDIIHIEKVEL